MQHCTRPLEQQPEAASACSAFVMEGHQLMAQVFSLKSEDALNCTAYLTRRVPGRPWPVAVRAVRGATEVYEACPSCRVPTSCSIAGVPERAESGWRGGTCRRTGPVRSRAGVPARPRLRRRRSARSWPPRWRQSPAPGPPLGRLRMSRCAPLQGPLPGVNRAAVSSPRSMLSNAEELACLRRP